MSLYQININRSDYAVPVDMPSVYAALEAGHIEIDKEERAPSLSGVNDEQPEYVYIADGRLSDAVRVIQSLGYTTDEDDVLDEE